MNRRKSNQPGFVPPTVYGDRPDLSAKEFDRFRALIYEHSGINLTDDKRDLLRARLGKRMRQQGLASYDDYLKMIDRDKSGQEIIHLIDAVSTNVTFFFREQAHFDFLKTVVLPGIRKKAGPGGRSRIRFWSAGCSTGEEPYSLAMTVSPLIEAMGNRWDLKILASDISTKVLTKAKLGVYSRTTVKGLNQTHIDEFFTGGNGTLMVRPEIKSLITFARVNLQKKFPFRGPFDVIFCRNVMIYFDQATQERLVAKFYDYLTPGGFLFIGHSENLSMVRHQFSYVKPAVYRK